MAHVRNAIVADGLFLAPKMRDEDKDELLAADGVQPMAALLEPFKHRGARNYSVIGTEEEAKRLGQIQADCMLEAGQELGFKIPTPGSYDVGKNWA